MKPKGFTLIEMLVLIAIIAMLAVALLVTLNPLEQLYKSRDMATLKLSTDVQSSVTRIYSSNLPLPWDKDLDSVSLSSNEGQAVINNIIQRAELKSGFGDSNINKFSDIYLTAQKDNPEFNICFLPRSLTFQNMPETRYNQQGIELGDCQSENCYYCIGKKPELGEQDPSEMTEEELCQNFNPEYPKYPWTSNYSSKWSQYGCTNYSVADLGCGTGSCKPDERQLRKNYYGVPTFPNFVTCIAHQSETQEHYCVGGYEGGCSIIPYQSSPSDFDHGCTDPRRPFRWKSATN